MREPRKFAYESMGTEWGVAMWDDLDPTVFDELCDTILERSRAFDQLYSRFIPTSLVWTLANNPGVHEVPMDLIAMLRWYEKLHDLSGGKITPLIGHTISDLGYDAEYSLMEQSDIRRPPEFHAAVRILDDTHLELTESVLLDVGALGKGYFVDRVASFLRQRGIRRFLVDGSGDIYYEGDGHPLRAGLEDPADKRKVIGAITFLKGGFCASGSNIRRWRNHHHIIDPHSLESPEEIAAAWVLADSATLADGLATSLFLCEPDRLRSALRFEYCLLDQNRTAKRSAGFAAELF